MSNYKPKYDSDLDGVVIDRANREFALKYKLEGAHYIHNGVTLCGTVNNFAAVDSEVELCPKCQSVGARLYDEIASARIRDYWRKPSGGSAVTAEPVIRKPKQVVEYKQLEFGI